MRLTVARLVFYSAPILGIAGALLVALPGGSNKLHLLAVGNWGEAVQDPRIACALGLILVALVCAGVGGYLVSRWRGNR